MAVKSIPVDEIVEILSIDIGITAFAFGLTGAVVFQSSSLLGQTLIGVAAMLGLFARSAWHFRDMMSRRKN